MSLRVAFDMDGTLADMHAVLRQEARRLFGEGPEPDPPPPADPPPAEASSEPITALPPLAEALHLTSVQQRQLWAHVQQIENFWTTLPEQETGIIARLAEVARERRWEVLFITTRPSSAGETTQRQTQAWLERHGFAWPSVFVVQRSRGKVAEALQLDAVVDDRPENCLDVALDSKARPLLIWPADPATAPAALSKMGVRTVPTPSAALTLLARLDDRRKHPRMVRSIRKMLSLDELDRL